MRSVGWTLGICIYHLGPGGERIGKSGSGWVSGLFQRAPAGGGRGVCGCCGWWGPCQRRGLRWAQDEGLSSLVGLGQFTGHHLGCQTLTWVSACPMPGHNPWLLLAVGKARSFQDQKGPSVGSRGRQEKRPALSQYHPVATASFLGFSCFALFFPKNILTQTCHKCGSPLTSSQYSGRVGLPRASMPLARCQVGSEADGSSPWRGPGDTGCIC